MKLRYCIVLLIVLLGNIANGYSQKEVRKQLRSGNNQYNKEHYTEAEISYRKALEANSRSTESAYNLGNALYKQGKFQEALEQYQAVLNNNQNKQQLAKTWHNIGNITMNAKDYAKSINAYKNALINNPSDDETRYNLALAQKLLNDQQQQDQDQNQDQDKQDQKDQEKKQDEQKQDQKDQQDQQQDKDQKNQDKQEQQQQQNSGMDKQKAEQILDAMSQDEKRTQEKVKEEEAKRATTRSKPDKDW